MRWRVGGVPKFAYFVTPAPGSHCANKLPVMVVAAFLDAHQDCRRCHDLLGCGVCYFGLSTDCLGAKSNNAVTERTVALSHTVSRRKVGVFGTFLGNDDRAELIVEFGAQIWSWWSAVQKERRYRKVTVLRAIIGVTAAAAIDKLSVLTVWLSKFLL